MMADVMAEDDNLVVLNAAELDEMKGIMDRSTDCIEKGTTFGKRFGFRVLCLSKV